MPALSHTLQADESKSHIPRIHRHQAHRHHHSHRQRCQQLAVSMSAEKASTSVNVVIPVYNEEAALPTCVSKLSAFLSEVRCCC